jgi:MFS family permease
MTIKGFLVMTDKRSLCWAVVLACHGAASNFGGLLALRLLLGALESSISPGLSMMTGVWYKRDEHVSRHGVWFAGNGTASLIGGLLAYGIGHINNSVAAWRVSGHLVFF